MHEGCEVVRGEGGVVLGERELGDSWEGAEVMKEDGAGVAEFGQGGQVEVV